MLGWNHRRLGKRVRLTSEDGASEGKQNRLKSIRGLVKTDGEEGSYTDTHSPGGRMKPKELWGLRLRRVQGSHREEPKAHWAALRNGLPQAWKDRGTLSFPASVVTQPGHVVPEQLALPKSQLGELTYCQAWAREEGLPYLPHAPNHRGQNGTGKLVTFSSHKPFSVHYASFEPSLPSQHSSVAVSLSTPCSLHHP